MAKYPNVSFRLSDLADEVLARGKSISLIAKRDLNRYYTLLRRVRPRFDEDEAGFIIEAISLLQLHENPPHHDNQRRAASDLVQGYRNFLWATVSNADDIFSLSDKYQVDLKKLESRLRALHPCEELAVLDAVERALLLKGRDARKAASKVGLA